jgi:pimeloyl-ACP methyl ester carboxylesterase
VVACGRAVGTDRQFYSTDDVVADLDQLRRALNAPTMALEATSYGTFVAEQYAMRHPARTQALVLDSVVPHAGIDALDIAAIRAVPRVLRSACEAVDCPGDPATDLANVVRRDHNGPQLLDLVTSMSIVDPTFEPLLAALHAAAGGDEAQLVALQRSYRNGMQASAEQLSQGLHASALCSDSHFPWGTSAAPARGREVAVRRAVRRHSSSDLWPFDKETATGNGFVRQCRFWPRTPDAPLRRTGDLPRVRTLLLSGTRDLSTPLVWARWELRHAPDGRLVVVPGAGHATVRQGGVGRDAMRAFLLR